uniref:Putative basic tail protein n=1 Tax=Ixodes ricinus TaxID=34613 RepID=A0A0K8RGT4_IXORI
MCLRFFKLSSLLPSYLMPTSIQLLLNQKQAPMVVLGSQSKSTSAKQTVQVQMKGGSGALVAAFVYMLATAQKANA